jgi:hypothetical protein
VPRLPLLFFGAAKDIPEAAKTVTAGSLLACLHQERLQTRKPTAKPSSYAAASE